MDVLHSYVLDAFFRVRDRGELAELKRFSGDRVEPRQHARGRDRGMLLSRGSLEPR